MVYYDIYSYPPIICTHTNIPAVKIQIMLVKTLYTAYHKLLKTQFNLLPQITLPNLYHLP